MTSRLKLIIVHDFEQTQISSSPFWDEDLLADMLADPNIVEDMCKSARFLMNKIFLETMLLFRTTTFIKEPKRNSILLLVLSKLYLISNLRLLERGRRLHAPVNRETLKCNFDTHVGMKKIMIYSQKSYLQIKYLIE